MTATPAPFRVVAFSGSLRAGSSNTALIHLAARVAPNDLAVHIVDWIDELPYYNADLEADLPEVVVRWRQTVADADALIMGMPEYNFGPSAVIKNAIDWVTRPTGESALTGKVIALLTSAGKSGGARVQAALGPILGLLGNTVIDEPVVQIAGGSMRMPADGHVDDQEIVELVTGKMANVAAALRVPAEAAPAN